MVNVDLYSAIVTKVSNVLNMLVSREKTDFQALSKGLVVLLCMEVANGDHQSDNIGNWQTFSLEEGRPSHFMALTH